MDHFRTTVVRHTCVANAGRVRERNWCKRRRQCNGFFNQRSVRCRDVSRRRILVDRNLHAKRAGVAVPFAHNEREPERRTVDDAEPETRSDRDGQSNAYAGLNGNSAADCNAGCDADNHIDADPDRNAYAYAYAHAYTHGYTDTDCGENARGHRSPGPRERLRKRVPRPYAG